MSGEARDINEFIDEFVQVFEGWSGSIEDKARAFGRHRSEFLKDSQNRVKQLNEKDERVRQTAVRIHSEIEKENEDMGNVMKSLQSLKEAEKKLPQKLQQAQKEREALIHRENDLIKNIEKQQRELEESITNLETVSAIYKNALGLEFRTIPGYVHCIFTLLDHSNPSREFSFMLSLTESSEYSITDCSPGLPKEKIQQIVTTANQNNELGPLMKELRNLFRSYL